MALNGGPYLAAHETPHGALLEIEAGMTLSYRVRIVFPLAGFANPPRPGLEIVLDPSAIEVGKDLTFDAKSEPGQLQLSYIPALGHNFSEGQLLVFNLGPDGNAQIVVDHLEAEYGGRVQGTLREAILYGAYESIDLPSLLTPSSPLKLELRNFPFDVTLEEAWW